MSVHRSASVSREIKKEEVLPEPKKETRKRKRQRGTSKGTPNDATADSTANESVMTQTDVTEPATSTPKIKRQKRSQVSEDGSPTQILDEMEHSALDLPQDEPEMETETVFTLRKRELRNMSPEIHSDPVSESSPSVYSRIRKRSSSQDRAVPISLQDPIEPLQDTSEPLVIHDDMDVQEEVQEEEEDEEGEVAEDEEEEVAEEETDEVGVEGDSSRLTDLDKMDQINSDDVMQLQIQNSVDEVPKELLEEQDLEQGLEQGLEQSLEQDLEQAMEHDMEQSDEDLFILQLQQYRSSLKQGRPITPRRRERMGLLMKQITSLSGEVTAAYFDN